jgi:hypothetical protein
MACRQYCRFLPTSTQFAGQRRKVLPFILLPVPMMGIYHRAWEEVKYKATRFHQMLCDHGGLETAKILLHSNNVSEG